MMSGTRLPEFVESSGMDSHGAYHSSNRSGRAPTNPSSNAPMMLPPTRKKSLSSWGSYQVEFDGAGKDPSRKRPNVPTLGPLSYSLPVTPQGRGGNNASWDGGAADLAREAAEGWSVPPMPYMDDIVTGTNLSSQYQYPHHGFMTAAARAPTPENPSLAALFAAHESSRGAREMQSRNGGSVGERGSNKNRGSSAAEDGSGSKARRRSTTDGAFLLPPQTEAQSAPVRSPLSMSSSPRLSLDDGDSLSRSLGVGHASAVGRAAPIEGMLQKMADACRQAGVVLDPSLEDQLDTVLSRHCAPTPLSPTAHPVAAAPRVSPLSMMPLRPPSHPEISRAPSAETVSPQLASRPTAAAATALGTRAENPWGWAPEEGGGGPGVSRRSGPGDGERLHGESRSLTPPTSRDRPWTVPSPYQSLDEKFMAIRCIPELRLPEGVHHGVAESWRTTSSCGGGNSGCGAGDKEGSDGENKGLSDVSTSGREISRASWKEGIRREASSVEAVVTAAALVAQHRSRHEKLAAGLAPPACGSRIERDALPDIVSGIVRGNSGGSGGVARRSLLDGRSVVWPQSDSESFEGDDVAFRRQATSKTPTEWGDTADDGKRESGSTSSRPAVTREVEVEVDIETEVKVEATKAEKKEELAESSEREKYSQDGRIDALGEAEREELAPSARMGRLVDVEDADEWDDDLDPGYTVLAVSEDEFLHGQESTNGVRPENLPFSAFTLRPARSIHPARPFPRPRAAVLQYDVSAIQPVDSHEGLVGERCAGDVGGSGLGGDRDVDDGDVSSRDSPAQEPVEDCRIEDSACLVGGNAPDRGGGGDGGDGDGDQVRSGEGESFSIDVGFDDRRRSWASASTGDLIHFSGGEDSPPPRRRASDVNLSGSSTNVEAFGMRGAPSEAAAAATVAKEAVLKRMRDEDGVCSREAQRSEEEAHKDQRVSQGPLGSSPSWEEQYRRRIEGAGLAESSGGGGGGGGARLGGEEGYGNGPAYERDLEEAVALLENGGFGLDGGEEAGTWRDDSFSECPSSPVDDDKGGRRTADGEDSSKRRVELGGSGIAGVAVVDDARQESDGSRCFETAAPVAVRATSLDESSWETVHIRRQSDYALESTGSAERIEYEGGKVSGGGDRDLIFREGSPESGAGQKDISRGGAAGGYDHVSSMWPSPAAAAAQFSFNPQGYGESAGFLDRELAAVKTALRRQGSATSSLEEAFGDGGQVSRTHDQAISSMRTSGGADNRPTPQDEWKEVQPHPRSAAPPTSSPSPPVDADTTVDTGVDVDGTTVVSVAGAGARMVTEAISREEMLLNFGNDASKSRASAIVDMVMASTVANSTPREDSARECVAGGGVAAAASGTSSSATAAVSGAGRDVANSHRPRPSASGNGSWGEPEAGGGVPENGGRVPGTSKSGSFSPSQGKAVQARGLDPATVDDGALVARRRGGEGGGDEEEEVDDALDELGTFNLRIVFAKGRTGFQESKEFDWPEGSVVADRYEVCGYIGKAAFSTALECRDLRRRRGEDAVCLKVIKNNKDFFDQSLDEIKLLQRIKDGGDPDEHHVLHMLDFFYFEEHLVIVSELLGDNLYEFSKAVKEAGHPPYFTLPRVCKIIRQCLEALSYINTLGMVHCDVKPENILLSNYGKAEVKLIDFGSSCFLTDRLTPYTQSRSYRAPEVVLGLPYGSKVDVWSLGAVVAELVTGNVLLQSESVQTMLARIQGIVGPFPSWMLMEGEDAPKYFTPDGCVYQRMADDSDLGSYEAGSPNLDGPSTGENSERYPIDGDASAARYAIIYPKKTTLKRRLRVNDEEFLGFVSTLLSVDPTLRPLAHEALHHSWIVAGMAYTDDELWYPPEDDKGRGPNESKGHSDDEASIDDDPDGDLIMTRRHSS